MTKIKWRMAYQVVIDEGAKTIQIGHKARLYGKRKADKVCKFWCDKGLDARVRCFGKIIMPEPPAFRLMATLKPD
jgi:hypothetical protein